MTTAHTAETYTLDEIKGLLQKLRATGKRAADLEEQKVDLVKALQNLISDPDVIASITATQESDARTALAKAGAA